MGISLKHRVFLGFGFSARGQTQTTQCGEFLRCGKLMKCAILCISIPLFALISPANSEATSCEGAKISFTAFEPKEFHRWTGRNQTSQLLVDGKKVEILNIRYPNFSFEPRQIYGSERPIQVLDRFIYLSPDYGSKGRIHQGGIYVFEDRTADGYIITQRVDGKTAAAIIYLASKKYKSVSVELDYPKTQALNTIALHIVCFLKSDFVRGQIK